MFARVLKYCFLYRNLTDPCCFLHIKNHSSQVSQHLLRLCKKCINALNISERMKRFPKVRKQSSFDGSRSYLFPNCSSFFFKCEIVFLTFEIKRNKNICKRGGEKSAGLFWNIWKKKTYVTKMFAKLTQKTISQHRRKDFQWKV